MVRRFCDVCKEEIVKGLLYVKVIVIGECGDNRVIDSHLSCLNNDDLRRWLELSEVGKVELVGMYEGDEL